jgi:hypothetical protein
MACDVKKLSLDRTPIDWIGFRIDWLDRARQLAADSV